MSLYTRLMGIDPSGPNISIHAFYSILAERKRGQVTNQQIIDAFALSAGEQTELTALWARVNNNLLQAGEVDDVLILAAHGIPPYHTEAAVKSRFGV